MITEDYCSYYVAKLLKEKGFDEPCVCCYKEGSLKTIWDDTFGEVRPQDWNSLSQEGYNHIGLGSWFGCISAPTHQKAKRWLRNMYNIHIEICLYKINPNDIEPKKSRLYPYYTFEVWDTINGNNIDKRLINDFIGNSYEEADDASIKYCLENLIE